MEGQEGAALQLAQPPGETRRAWCPTSRGRAACSWRTGACLRSWGSRTPCPGPPWGGRSPRTLMLPCLADGVFPGGARRAGERGLPVDHHPALRLPGRELPGTCRAAVLTPWCCHRAEDKRHRPLRGAGLAQRPGRLPLPPVTLGVSQPALRSPTTVAGAPQGLGSGRPGKLAVRGLAAVGHPGHLQLLRVIVGVS